MLIWQAECHQIEVLAPLTCLVVLAAKVLAGILATDILRQAVRKPVSAQDRARRRFARALRPFEDQ